MDQACSCFTCSRLDKVDFLKKNKTTSFDTDNTGPLDCLPDEVLMHIFDYIPPVNINNFITNIALEMVSKRFRRCAAENEKGLENGELVIGFHPDLPENQYLCHIGYFTLKLFLQRVKKITKIIINITDEWLCSEMTNQMMMFSGISAGIDDLFGEKIELRHLHLHKFRLAEDESLVEMLIINAQPFLQSAQITIRLYDIAENCFVIGPVLAECSLLKHVKFSMEKWENFDEIADFEWIHNDGHLDCFYELIRDELKSVDVLELDNYIHNLVRLVYEAATDHANPLNYQILRFTNPMLMNTHTNSNSTLMYVYFLMVHSPHATVPIRELEIHYCPHSDINIYMLPKFFQSVSHPIHLKMTFHPHFGLNNVPEIAQMLQNAQEKNVDGMKISITFKHSDIDREGKLAIVHNLLHEFDVAHVPQQEDIWQFIRGKLCVNLKLEKFQDESLICHPYPPPGE